MLNLFFNGAFTLAMAEVSTEPKEPIELITADVLKEKFQRYAIFINVNFLFIDYEKKTYIYV